MLFYKNQFLFVVLLLSIGFLLFGCSAEEGSGGLGSSCSNDKDCSDGFVCNSAGQCINVECTSNDQCSNGQICSVEHRCVNTTGADGDAASNCGKCPNGFVCNETIGICEQEAQPECITSTDCQTGYYCTAEQKCKPRSGADVDLEGVEGEVPNQDGDQTTPEDGDTITPVDGDSTDTSETTKDTDKDGIPDNIEDRNGNGEVDGGETDPNKFDSDEDGLSDGIEDANKNGIRELNETDPLNIDSDYDKIIDGEEDKNKNGEVDADETDPRLADTDDDGVIDGNEIKNGYSNNKSSDPLDRDTDKDTLLDGIEDANGNGKYDPDLGETDPTLKDSDGNGKDDNEEGVHVICQEDQLTKVEKHVHTSGDWTLALLPDIDYVELDMKPSGTERLFGAAIDDSTNNLAGFMLSRAPSSTVIDDQISADNALIENIAKDKLLNHRGRKITTYDGYDAMTSHYSIETTSAKTVGDIRDELLVALSKRSKDNIGALTTGSSESAKEFEILTEVILRDGNALFLAIVLSKTNYDNTAGDARIRATDITDASAVSVALRGTLDSCDPFKGRPPALVDYLWVVDDSGSMSQDQQQVSDAATVFGTVMKAAGIDYRVAVTSTDCTDVWGASGPAGDLGDHKFTSNISEFQSDVKDPPCGQSEYGLRSGWSTIEKAMGTTLPENQRFRQGAKKAVIFLSDENDQEYKDCSTASCENERITFYQNYFSFVEATCFAIVGDKPSGCGGASPSGGQGSGEAGSAYIDIAYHTGGTFGSICLPDFKPIMEEILRATAGTASLYELLHHPISSTIQVVVDSKPVKRSQVDGFEYDPVADTLVFYGPSAPKEGDNVVISYRFFRDDPKQ